MFRRRRVSVKAGRTLLISGPASLTLVDGKANILASSLKKGCKITIREGKQLPVESLENCTLDCYVSDSAAYLEIIGSTLPGSWVETAETIKKGKTIVIGNTDTGKSTFCTILANIAVNAGLKTAIIDADLGQSDIGPPGTIGLARLENHILSTSEVSPDLLYFVGYISPAPVVDKTLHGIESLLGHTANACTLVINTDGWVLDDQAIIYKKRLIDLVQPDYVVGIGREVSPILELTKQTSFQIDSPTAILRRTREQRRALRESGYRKYLTEGRVIRVDVDRVQLSYSDGRTLSPGDLDPSLVNALLGMIDGKGWLLGIGVLLEVGLRGNIVKAFSPVTSGFSGIEIGAVKLNAEGIELSYLE
jgi:polynucleotide 5'-hydroxyl-kinase GRC3/NOL9